MDTLFFIAAKLGWVLLRPSFWFLLLAAGTCLSLVRETRRTAIWLSGSMLGLFLIFTVAPIGSLALRSLETRYPAEPPLAEVAGIVVLGGGESGRLSETWGQPQVNEAGDRFLATLAVAQRYPDAVILFTGGIGSLAQDGLTGSDVAEEIFLSAGISPGRLLLERASRNTAENARNALALKPPEQPGTWVLVTSAFHTPRAIETFCAAGWTNLVPWPTDYRGTGEIDGIGWDFVGNLSKFDLALKEYVGLFAYRLTDRARSDDLGKCLAGSE